MGRLKVVCVCFFLFFFFYTPVNQSLQRVWNENLAPCSKIRAGIAVLKKIKKRQKGSLRKIMTSCLLDSPCRGGALWHSLQPRGLRQSRCYHLNCRSRTAAGGLPRAPMLQPTWRAWLSIWRIFFLLLYLLQITLWKRQASWLLPFCCCFSPSFLNGVVETQRGGREEKAIYSSTQSLPSRLQERIGEGNPVFLGHELVKHMMASECLGIISNARIWTQPWDQGSTPASPENSILGRGGVLLTQDITGHMCWV